VLELLCLLGCLRSPAPDTINVARAPSVPVLDGRPGEAEYGAVALRITTAAGEVRVWVARHDGYVYVAAQMPDTSFYWGDDFVVSVDANGSAGAAPQSGDRQWYLRRVLDSSVVSRASRGRWNEPAQPQPMLGPSRHGDDWDVASTSTASGWSVELRVRESALDARTAPPRVAFRTYNDNPRGWWSWPAPRGTPPQRVERIPELWAPLIIKR
jgi:hypothetical protein